MSRLSFLLFLLLPCWIFAQPAVTGKVINMGNNTPVSSATVFLGNSSVGTITDKEGNFRLASVRNGQYDLVITCIGYETHHQSILFNGAGLNVGEVKLMPKVTELKEVKVKYDASRERYLGMFKQEFLGYTENAKQCFIKNPEVLDVAFDKGAQTLTAGSDDFLLVENKALGYILHYQVSDFNNDYRSHRLYYAGDVRFEPMKGNKSDEKRWKKARLAAYVGSDMHFLRSCIAGAVESEKFTVQRIISKPNKDRPSDSLINAKIKQFTVRNTTNNFIMISDSSHYWYDKKNMPKEMRMLIKTPLKPADYYQTTDQPGIYAFNCTDLLRISYRNKDTYTTTIQFYKPAYFDNNGIILTPESTMNEGYWGTQRVANMLPVDYEP